MEELIDSANQMLSSGESMDSLIIYRDYKGYFVNEKDEDIFDVRSISKTILAIACGILIEKSNYDFNEESLIYPMIKDKINLTNKKNLRYLKQVKVKHLLTHTTGYRDLLLFSKDIRNNDTENLLDYVINYPIYYKPGNYFLYSNAGYYLLAATMQEYLEYDLFDFIKTNLLEKLEINNASWERYGDYIAGATKIHLSADAMLSIGKLLLNKGKFKGKEIISNSWIEKMIKPLFKNPNENKRKFLSEDSYGYGIWISDNGVIFASGTGGQLIVLLQKLGTIIVTTNSGSDNKSYRIKSDVDKIISIINERQ